MQVRGALFDMDGVIIDNHKYHFKAWMSFAKKYDFPLNEQIYRDDFNGKTNKDLFSKIFKDLSVNDLQKYVDEKEDMYVELYQAHMKPLDGIVDFLNQLKKNGIKIALGTSAPSRNVDFILDGLKLRDYFDVIIDGKDVTRGKPDPEVYELCAKRLNLKNSECVVFEDALAGLEAGINAGSIVVGVVTSHSEDELKVKTNRLIYNFRDINAKFDKDLIF